MKKNDLAQKFAQKDGNGNEVDVSSAFGVGGGELPDRPTSLLEEIKQAAEETKKQEIAAQKEREMVLLLKAEQDARQARERAGARRRERERERQREPARVRRGCGCF